MELLKTMVISAAGLRAQGKRMRVIAENMANADSRASTPGGEPYRRKVVTFKNVLDRKLDADVVKVAKIGVDRSDFGLKYDPGHPAANEDGYVLTPNVQGLVEVMDMGEAQRSYEANLKVIQAARQMLSQTVELLR